jgi:low affinity Fe/Cu permease
MKKEIGNIKPSLSERFALGLTQAARSTSAFIIAFVLVIIWGATGPNFIIPKTGNQ